MAKKPSHLKLRRRVTLLSLTLVLAAAAAFSFSARGCEGTASASTASVKIAGQAFTLELAADNDTRYPGLSERKSIEDDGGMIFVFPRSRPLSFVMRDCLIDIDIIYLNPKGEVVQTYTMKMEERRGPGEGAIGDINAAYNDRLKKYASGPPAQIAIEIKAGLVTQLGVKPGDKIELDLNALKKAAK